MRSACELGCRVGMSRMDSLGRFRWAEGWDGIPGVLCCCELGARNCGAAAVGSLCTRVSGVMIILSDSMVALPRQGEWRGSEPWVGFAHCCALLLLTVHNVTRHRPARLDDKKRFAVIRVGRPEFTDKFVGQMTCEASQPPRPRRHLLPSPALMRDPGQHHQRYGIRIRERRCMHTCEKTVGRYLINTQHSSALHASKQGLAIRLVGAAIPISAFSGLGRCLQPSALSR